MSRRTLVKNGEVLLFSDNGSLIKKKTILTTQTEMNIDLPSGAYILAIKNNKDNSVSSFKIIKK